jgi:hypothetical protein
MTLSDARKIENYYSLLPTKFSVLRRMVVEQEIASDTAPQINVTFELGSNEIGVDDKLVLQFMGVRQLQLNQPSWSLVALTLIEIASIRDSQWENINYKVAETEEDIFSLLCRDFSAQIEK